MEIIDVENLKSKYFDNENVRKVEKKILMDPKKAPTFVMRKFILNPHGYILEHTHSWEHEIYVLKGKMLVGSRDGKQEVREGMFIFVEPNEPHSYENPFDEPCEFICVVPKEGER